MKPTPQKNRKEPEPQEDRLLPSAPKAEAAVLGCILLDYNALAEAQMVIRSPEYFYDERNRVLWDIVTDLKAGVDSTTVLTALFERKKKELVGYVSSLTEEVHSVVNLPRYLDIVRKNFILRRIIQQSQEMVQKAFDHEGDLEPLLSEFEKEALAIRGTLNIGGVVDVSKTLDSLICAIQAAAEEGRPIGAQTGILELDEHMGGMKKAQVIGISAEPSTGKTSLAAQIALNRIFNYGEAVGWFSLETDAETMLTRFICNRQQIDSRRLMSRPTCDELNRFGRGKMELERVKDKIMMCDDSDLTAAQIRSRARRMVQQGAKLLVLDFLQLVKHKDPKKGKTEVVSETAYEVKAMAKELDVPVIAICSLSNEGNLKNSGDIGYSLDIHITLKKGEKCGDEDKNWTVIARFAKGKDCGTATKALSFTRPYYRFTSKNEE